MRNLKALGLALVAIFAMCAVAAQGASAEDLFHSEVEHTILDARALNNQVFVTPVGSVECESLSVEATLSAKTVAEITAAPTYGKPNLPESEHAKTECKANIAGSLLDTRVTFTECHYLFTSATNATGHHITHVVCPTGQEIHIEPFILGKYRKCFTIPTQTPTGGGVQMTNHGAGATRDITLNATVEGIEYTKEGSCGTGTANDATYNGESTVTGTDTAGNQVGIWVE